MPRLLPIGAFSATEHLEHVRALDMRLMLLMHPCSASTEEIDWQHA